MKLNILLNFKKNSLTLFLLLFVSSYASGQANFTMDPASGTGCAPTVINCFDASTGASSWLWNVTGGPGAIPASSGSVDQSPGFTFTEAGDFVITLTINGGTSSFSRNVTIFKIPEPGFTADITSGCAPLCVQFMDETVLGDAPITNWEWDLGEPPARSEENPNICYEEKNIFDVVLVVTDANGCSAFIREDDFIDVNKAPIPSFTVSPLSSCETPFSPNVTNTTDVVAGVDYNWTVSGTGASVQNPTQYDPGTITYANNGTYNITLDVDDNGCVDDTTVGPIVVDALISDFTISDDTPCRGEAITFTDDSNLGGLIYQWYNNGSLIGGNTSTISQSFNAVGMRNICLVTTTLDGVCRDSICKMIDVQDGPTGDFSANNVSACGAPLTSNFTSSITGAANYLWSVSPSAGVTPSASSTDPNPSFTFGNAGNYSVTLVVTSANGCSRTISKNNFIRINNNINVSITTSPSKKGCAPFDVDLDISGSGLPAGVSITSVLWDLPGGTNTGGPGSPTGISTTYNSFGDYPVTATVNFSGGCSQTVTATEINVGDKPMLTIDVTPRNICLNESVVATGTSNIPNTQFDFYFQSVEVNNVYSGYVDGGVGTVSNTPYTYEDEWAQPFDVVLIGDVNGCTDTVRTTVIVNPPAALYEWESICGEETEVTLLPNIPQAQFGDDFSWYIVSGPGASNTPFATSTGPTPQTIDLGSVDIFEVQLIVSSSVTGCTDSVTNTIDLINGGAGNAIITPRNACPNETITFRETTPGVVTWKWYFGDGDSTDFFSPATNITHQYENTGVYVATLITRDNADCIRTSSYQIVIGGGTADIIGTLGSCDNTLTTTFDANGSVFQIGGVETANWVVSTDLGTQPFTDVLVTDPVTFGAPGQYSVMVTAFDSIGCSDDTTVTVLVGGAIADFTSDKTAICPGEEVSFSNLSLGGNLTYNWSFPGGTPSTSTDENPKVVYGSSGQYDVTLSVVSNAGATCTDAVTKMFFITVTGSGFDFEVDEDSASCPTLASNFILNPTPMPGQVTNIHWYFELSSEVSGFAGDELSSNSYTPGFNIYTAGGPDGDGYYDVAVVIETLGGCPDSIYKDDFIFVGGQTGSFTFTPDTLCAPDDVVFSQVGVQRTDTILWDFGDGQTQDELVGVNNLTVTYDDPGVYTPVVLLKNADCPPIRATNLNSVSGVSGSGKVYVSRLKAEAITDQTFLCDSGPIMFMDSTTIDSAAITGDFVASQIWDFGDGSTSSQSNPTHTYTGNMTGVLDVIYTVTTDFGCTDRDTFEVKIFETPNGTVGPGASICIGDPVALSASGADNYQWEPASLVINNTSPNPTVLPTDTTVFTVAMYNDTVACADTQMVQVDVLKEIQGLAGPDAQICAGQSVELSAEATAFPQNGTIDFAWFDAGGQFSSSPNPTVSPSLTQTYSVTISSGLCAPAQANVTVEVTGSSFVDAGEDQIVEAGTIVDLTAFSPDITIYNWFDEQGNFINNTQSITTNPINQTSTFFVEVGNGGCRAADSVVVLILESCDNGIADIPNVFSPNNDGVNDVLKINPGLGIAEVSALKIFNRWGEIVFEADAASSAWDGTQNGVALDPGVYVYYMELICVNEERSIRKGNITLLK